ncbi:hypothetical protein AB0M29_23780 [Streptomyces sp. NPDC051976]|uniref:hypothetical protein n=1 Tax=Streptomyces sp. NPDC051976 TaxID=3154947 RepID=UPI003417CCCD
MTNHYEEDGYPPATPDNAPATPRHRRPAHGADPAGSGLRPGGDGYASGFDGFASGGGSGLRPGGDGSGLRPGDGFASGGGPGPQPGGDSFASGGDGYAASGQSGFASGGDSFAAGGQSGFAPGGDGYAAPGQSGYAAGHGSGFGVDGQYGYGGGGGGAGQQGQAPQAYVPEPLAGPMPPHVDPAAAFGPPAAGDAWSDGAWEPQPQPQHAQAGEWPQPQPYRETERTAAMPVVEAPVAAPRSGSPIIAPGIQPAALTAALGLLMAGGAAVGKPGLALFLVALQAVTAAGWFRLNGMWPARQGILLAFLGGVTADIALLAVDGDHGPAALVGTLGVWLVLVLVLQLRHHGSADERMSSLTATSASTLLTVLAAGYLATATSSAGTDPVVVGTLAVAAAALVRALPLPGAAVSIGAALLAAAGTGLASGPATGFGAGHGALLALACGAAALIGLRVASYDFPSRFVHFTAGVALPLTAAAPVVYALGRALAG